MNPEREYFMIKEIRDTPRALAKVLEEEGSLRQIAEGLFKSGVRRLFLTGCGSSYYAALVATQASAAPFLFQALPSSEMLFYQSGIAPRESAVIGISRSGRTAETLAALREARTRGITTVAITCSEGSPMRAEADTGIFLDVGEEKSIIMTKTFSSLSLASTLLCEEFGKIQGVAPRDRLRTESLPEMALQALRLEDDIKRIAEDVHTRDFFFVLGQGHTYPVALEGALKLMETCNIMTTALHILEFRHGPMAAVDDRVGIVVIALEDNSSKAVARLVKEAEQQGFRLFALSNIPELEDALELPRDLDLRLSAPVTILPIQLLAFYISVNRGLNPDSPRRLHKFVGGF